MILLKGRKISGIVILLMCCTGLASAQSTVADSLQQDNEILINYARMLEMDLANVTANVALLEIAAEKDSLLCVERIWWLENLVEAEKEAAPAWWNRLWVGAVLGLAAGYAITR